MTDNQVQLPETHLYVTIVIEQQILRLQIPMHDHVTMAVVYAGDDLLKEPASFRFLQLPIVDDVIEQLATADVLHDHKDVGRRRDDLVQLDDVRMAEELQILDFTPDLAHHIETLDLLTIQYLDRHLVLRHLMLTDLDLSERSRAERGTENVVTDLDQRLGRRTTRGLASLVTHNSSVPFTTDRTTAPAALPKETVPLPPDGAGELVFFAFFFSHLVRTT